MLMDYTQKPGFLMKYKIQEGKNTPPNTAKTIKVSKASEASFAFLDETCAERMSFWLSYTIVAVVTLSLKTLNSKSFACSENSESELCERQVFFPLPSAAPRFFQNALQRGKRTLVSIRIFFYFFNR